MKSTKLPNPRNSVKPKQKKAQKKFTTKEEKIKKDKGLDQDIIIESIKPYLQLGYSLKKSCLLAGVAYTTVHTWCRNNPSLRILFYSYSNLASVKSRQNIVKEIQSGSVENSWRWLGHKDTDFNQKTINIKTQQDDLDEEFAQDEQEARIAGEELEKILQENDLI